MIFLYKPREKLGAGKRSLWFVGLAHCHTFSMGGAVHLVARVLASATIVA
jgi:hypothetical protein